MSKDEIMNVEMRVGKGEGKVKYGTAGAGYQNKALRPFVCRPFASQAVAVDVVRARHRITQGSVKNVRSAQLGKLQTWILGQCNGVCSKECHSRDGCDVQFAICVRILLALSPIVC